MNTSKPLYELFHPHQSNGWDNREYVVVVRNIGKYKYYGYVKYVGQPAKRQTIPPNYDMRFVGYMKEKAFEELIFVDLL